MSDYVILKQSTITDLTGGFTNTLYGTGVNGNPSISKTNNLYQWRASYNNGYNSAGMNSFPKVFADNPKLMAKYKKIRITYSMSQYSPRAYNNQGISAYFRDANGNDLGLIFNAKVMEAGSTSRSGTAEIDIPKNAVQIRIDVNANNDDNASNTTCQISEITLVGKRVTANLGGTEINELYLGTTEISQIYLGNKEL